MYTKSSKTFSFLLWRLKGTLLVYLLYVTGIYVAYAYIGIKEIDISMSIATVLGFSVALLLGFRTAASYDRWWEARKIWGAIVNDSRTLVRQAIGFTGGAPIIPEVQELAYHQIAWCRSLRNVLRKLDPIHDLEPYLAKEVIDKLKAESNVPNAILKLMEIKLVNMKANGHIDSYQQVALDQTLKDLCDSMGMCERIKNTVFPVQYRTYTHRGITIFTLMLPFGMLYSTGPFVILISTIVAFFFAMIETIAYFMQDPFRNRPSDIPMSALSRTIEINLLQMIGEDQLPEPIVPDEDGMLM